MTSRAPSRWTKTGRAQITEPDDSEAAPELGALPELCGAVGPLAVSVVDGLVFVGLVDGEVGELDVGGVELGVPVGVVFVGVGVPGLVVLDLDGVGVVPPPPVPLVWLGPAEGLVADGVGSSVVP